MTKNALIIDFGWGFRLTVMMTFLSLYSGTAFIFYV